MIVYLSPDRNCACETYGLTTGANMQANVWYHVAFVFDGRGVGNTERLKIYLNGVQLPVSYGQPIPSTLNTGQAAIRMATGINGEMDEARIYTVARNSTDVALDAAGQVPATQAPPPPTPTPAPGPNATPLAYWKMEEGTGTTVMDASGHGHDLALAGSPAWSTEVPSAVSGNTHSVRFNGLTNYAHAFPVTETGGADQLTVETWVRWAGNPGGRNVLLSAWEPANYQWALFNEAQELAVFLSPDRNCACGTYGFTTGANMQANVWYHIAFVFDGRGTGNAERLKIYLNGTQLPVSYTWPIQPSLNAGADGEISMAVGVNGEMDEARIYNLARNSTDIALDAAGLVPERSHEVGFGSSVNRVSLPPGTSTNHVIQIKNTDAQTHTVSALGSSSEVFAEFLTSTPFDIGPGDVVSVTLRVDATGPVAPGAYSGVLNLISDAQPDHAYSVLNVVVSEAAQADLTTIGTQGTLAVAPSPAVEGQGLSISATVNNKGTAPSEATNVTFWDGASLLGVDLVAALQPGEQDAVGIDVPSGLTSGYHVIRVEIAPLSQGEISVGNNSESLLLQVGQPTLTQAALSVSTSATIACGTNEVYLLGHAQYVISTGSAVQTYPVQGGQVTLTLTQGGQPLGVLSGLYTATSGHFQQSLGVLSAGTYLVTAQVTDGTLIGSIPVSVAVPTTPLPCPTPTPPPPPPTTPPPPTDLPPTDTPTPVPTQNPDVYVHAEDIAFKQADCVTPLSGAAGTGEAICVEATFHYQGPNAALRNQPVSFSAVASDGVNLNTLPIGSTLITFPAPGTAVAHALWTPAANGAYIIQVQVWPSVAQPTANDAATRALFVGQSTCQLTTSSPSLMLVPGGQDTVLISGLEVGSTSGDVALTVQGAPPSGLPNGLTASIVPVSTTMPFTATLHVATTTGVTPGQYNLLVSAQGGGCQALAVVSIVISTSNSAPLVDAPTLTPQPVLEGSTVALGATFTDPSGSTGPYTCVTDYGDHSGNSAGTVTGHDCAGPIHTYADSGSYTVAVTVTNGVGQSGVHQRVLSVVNVAPSAVISATSPVFETQNYDVSLSNATDPSSVDQAEGFSYRFDCGDGGGFGSLTSNSFATCVAGAPGTRVVRGAILDKDGGTREYTSTVLIQSLPLTATVTIHVHSDVAPGTGRSGYLVRIFNAAGTEIGNKTTDPSGNATWTLNNGAYQYRVDRAGAQSARRSFMVAGLSQTLNYRLAAVTVRVTDNASDGKAGYLVRVFNGTGGSGSEWGNATSNADGLTTFYLLEGAYGYRVDRAGASSVKAGFTVTAGIDATLTYHLATIKIQVADNTDAGKAGYLVRVFNGSGGSGTEWGNASSDSAGLTTYYLLEGDYGYRVDRAGAMSAKVGFTVAGGVDQTLVYHLATVTIQVVDNTGVGKAGYLVRVFNGVGGSGAEWGNATSDANGMTTFYLVEGSYGYRVDRAGALGVKVGFIVAAGVDQALIYRVATVTIKVADTNGVGRPGYLVRIFNGPGGSGTQWGNATTDASGLAMFYLIPAGDYGFKVERSGAVSGATGFTVSTGTELTLTYTVATVTIKVTDSNGVGKAGYLVRTYNGTNGSGSEWGNATSDANGLASFELLEGSYGYRVERSGAVGGKVGFVVSSGVNQLLTYHLATLTVRVVDVGGSGKAGYLVRLFNGVDGAGAEWGNATTSATGEAVFYVPEGSYGYRVDRSGAMGSKIGLTASVGATQTVTYTLARITVHVQTSGGNSASGYLVRLFNGTSGSGVEWGNQTTTSSGNAVFDVPSGGFQYQVEKTLYNSGRQPTGGVTVLAGASTQLTHTLP